MIKESIYQKDKTIINVHIPNNTASKYMTGKMTKLKGETDNSTIIGDFNTLSQKLAELLNKTSVKTQYLNKSDIYINRSNIILQNSHSLQVYIVHSAR